MKLLPYHASRFTFHDSTATPIRRRQSGSAVIIVMALLAIILVYVAGNLRTINSLGRELKLLEQQQTRRLQRATQTTNTPPTITVATNSVAGSPTR